MLFLIFFFFFFFEVVSFGMDWDKTYFKVFFFFILFSNLNGLCGGWNILACWPLCLIFLSLMFWGMIMLYWGSLNGRSLICHLVPLGVGSFGVLPIFFIELVRLGVRPFTLRLRLIVNIMAGMLFFDLMEGFGFGIFSFFFLGCYEGFVCVIQALIYCLLVLNYNEEAWQRL